VIELKTINGERFYVNHKFICAVVDKPDDEFQIDLTLKNTRAIVFLPSAQIAVSQTAEYIIDKWCLELLQEEEG